MTTPKTPQPIEETALDDISGGPTEELFGAYNVLGTAGKTKGPGRLTQPMTRYIGETEKN